MAGGMIGGRSSVVMICGCGCVMICGCGSAVMISGIASEKAGHFTL